MRNIFFALLLIAPSVWAVPVTDFPELATTPADDDVLPVVDVSDGVNGTTKKITWQTLMTGVLAGNAATATLAATATAAASNPANCSAGNLPRGVDANWAGEGCNPVNLASEVTGDLPLSNLAQGSALSLLGVAANSTADNASIAAASDHQVMRRSGTAIAFGAVNIAQSNAITGILPAANGGAGSTNGVLKANGSGTVSASAFGDIVGLWASGSCTGYLKNDGTCDTPAGGGDVEMGTETVGKACVAAGGNVIDCDSTLAEMPASTAQGDTLYLSAADTLARLAKDTNATRYMANTGTNNNPAWAQIDLTNGVTGDLPFANLAQVTARSVLGVTGNSTADAASIQGTANQVLRVNGAGTALAFGQLDISQSAAITGTLPVANGGTGITAFGTGVATALGVNTGSAGAFGVVIAKGTSALGTSAINTGTCATAVTTTATGTATTDVINWGFNGDPTGVTGYAASASGGLFIYAYPSANNVNFKVCNNTAGNITPTSMTLNWIVIR